MTLSAYALPAAVALVAKVGLFFYSRHSKVHNLQTQLYLLFLFCLAIQNLTEIALFTDLVRPESILPGGKLWYNAIILAIPLFAHLGIVVGTSWRGASSASVIPLYLPAIVLTILLWGTPRMLAGYEPMNYTVTKIPGDLYFVFELYAVSYLLATIAIFIHGARTQKAVTKRLQCKFLVFSFAPFVVLAVAVIVLQRYGFRGFNATATLPLVTTFFLAVTAYAIHQYRLFDIEFFLPWSKIRKRKTEFYKRIQALIAEIAEMSSVQKIIQSISDALRCPVALIGGPTPSLAMAGEAFGIARFPLDELKKVNHILVANEIAEAMPTTHVLMKRHNVAAIVPFHPHSQAAASWMLLGEAFSEQVYSPLDFRTVETLFARLAEHFLDNQLLLRSQLLEARREMDTLHARLANAWEQIETLRRQLAETRAENQQIRQQESATSNRGLATTQSSDTSERRSAKRISLDEQVAEYETRLIAKTLEHCGGDIPRAAELLGLPIGTLHGKLRQIANRENDPPEPQVLFV